ncbi:hypothetical protein Tco_1196573 [Tanacetum coccineum]
MTENKDHYHDTVLNLEEKVKKNVDMVLKIGNYVQGMFMLGPKPMSFYDSKLKHGLGYANPYTLKKAISQNLKLYDATCLDNSQILMHVKDTKDTLEDATKSQIKMKNKMQDPIAIQKKQNVCTIDYTRLNALYDDFVPQKELSDSKTINSWKATLKHEIECYVLLSHECVDNNMRDEIEKVQKDSIEIQERMQKRLSATFSVRRSSNRDSSFKDSVVSNTNNSAEKVEVSDRIIKKPDVASKNTALNTFVTNDEIKNALIAKNVLCVTCTKNVLIPCHNNCLAKYKLNVRSNVRRALFTTPRTVKYAFKDTTPVVSKTRFSVRTVQSKSLATTPVFQS